MNESDRTVYFGAPPDRAWLPPKTKLLIDAAYDAGRAKISNGTASQEHATWEMLQLWADALLGIYLVSAGLSPHDNELSVSASDPRRALLEPETITKNVSARVLELVAEYNLPATPSDLERVTELVSHRTRGWLRRRDAELWGVDISEIELLVPPVVAPSRAAASIARRRSKDGQRERLKMRVSELRAAHCSHREICIRLDEDPQRYPSPWQGMTWIMAFTRKRKTVDSYISDLK